MTGAATDPILEASTQFACFGGRCAVYVIGDAPTATATAAVARAEELLLSWHERFTRFTRTSELSRLNQDGRTVVPVSPLMARFVRAGLLAARLTGGLVDPTLGSAIVRAGYAGDLAGPGLDLVRSLALVPDRRPGAPHPAGRWREVQVDVGAGTVSRPPGVTLDSGGIAKGLFGDLLVALLEDHDSVVIDCAGDLRLGGRGRIIRDVEVASPFAAQAVLHTFELGRGAVATSGIGRRSWIGNDGRPAHHLLDPATGRPAFTGVVQVTALAPTGVEAEARAKAALLAGPREAARWLPHGGVVVRDDGSHRVLPPPLTYSELLSQRSGNSQDRRPQ